MVSSPLLEESYGILPALGGELLYPTRSGRRVHYLNYKFIFIMLADSRYSISPVLGGEV